MVTLFHCLDCDDWSQYARGRVLMKFTLEIALHQPAKSVGVTIGKGRRLSMRKFARMKSKELWCYECGSPVEMVELESCPHDWWPEKLLDGQKKRTCSFCSETQVVSP